MPGSTLTSNSAVPTTSTPSSVLSSPGTISAVPIKDAPYGAELINRAKITPGTLISGDNYLFGVEPGYLDQIDPAHGSVLNRAPDSAQVTSAPVIVGGQVWAVTTYNSAVAILTGYNATTMQQVASVQVPVSGRVSFAAAGVLAAGSGHSLYLAAGNDIAVVSTDTHKVTRRFVELQGPIDSLATSPDGTRLYVSLGNVTLLTYELPGLAQLASSTMSVDGVAANLVATSGGVWGTLNTLTTTVWFAPGGNLAKLVDVGDATGANGYSLPHLQRRHRLDRRLADAGVCQPGDREGAGHRHHPRDNGARSTSAGWRPPVAAPMPPTPARPATGMAALTVPAQC